MRGHGTRCSEHVSVHGMFLSSRRCGIVRFMARRSMQYPRSPRAAFGSRLWQVLLSTLCVLAGAVLWPHAAVARTGSATPPAVEPADATSPARMRLLSQEQYANTIAYVFGPDIMVSANFAPFRRTDGLLANGSATAGVTIGQMQEFQRTAGALAATIVSPQNRGFLVPCTPRRQDTDTCAATGTTARRRVPLAL